MLKRSTAYRRLWYIRRRNARRIGIYLRLIVIFIILALLVSYATNHMFPAVMRISEHRTRSAVITEVNRVINSTFEGRLVYDELVTLHKDRYGKITSIEANFPKMNMLAAEISGAIQQKLSGMDKEKIAIPLGTLFGSTVLSGTGPDVGITVFPVGSVEASFLSDFSSEGINQTRHRISLEVRTKVALAAPLVKKEIEIATLIPVAETIIVGSVPQASPSSLP